VLDPNAAAVVEATVAAKNVDTGIETIVQTNSEGLYHIANLEPGNYEFSVSKRGFKVVVKPGVTLHVADTISMNFNMQVGDLKETVTVEAGAPMVNTTDASVSTVVDQTYVKNMPLNGRSFQDLILLTPGIVTNSPQNSATLGQTGEFSVNGQRTESNYYTVDGVSVNMGVSPGFGMVAGGGASGSVPAATGLGTTQALVSVDALQEFRVQSSTYSAEYGRNPGGQFVFETKSGTNQWHGTAYDYLRNDLLDATDWFNGYFGVKKPALRQNDFGGTFGGPVKIPSLYGGKDKTFFFVSYEGLRLIQPQAATASFVPDLCMRGLGACPSGRNPAPSPLQPALNAFPMPSPSGLEDATNGTGQFIGSWSNPCSVDSTSVRLDHVINDRLRVFFRFSDTGSDTAFRGGYAVTVYQLASYRLPTYTAGVSSIFSSRLSNEFRMNYSSNEVKTNLVIDKLGGSTPVNLAQLTGVDPQMGVAVFLFLGNFLGLAQQRNGATQSQWNLGDTVSFSFGRHQFKFGADYRRLTPVESEPGVSQFYYFGEQAAETNGAFTSAYVNAVAHPLYTNFSAFAQDAWKVSPRLSLSLGLRWEVNPAPGVTQGLKPYTLQGSGPDTWTLAPQGTPLWRTTWYNFAPRLGAAYVLRNAPAWETVVRGGGGVFFDTGQESGSFGFEGAGFQGNSAFLPGSFPVPATTPVIVNPPALPCGCGMWGFASHLQLPYTLHWNASIEQALGKSQAFTASYVGSHAARLLQNNKFQSSINPNGPHFYFTENGLTSDYDSLQIQFRRRLSQGLTTLGSYTWSHCIDYGSSNLLFAYQRSNCDVDVRHNLSAAFSYDLPRLGHSGFASAVLHHWGLDDRFTARTGFPVGIYGFSYGDTYFQPGTHYQTTTQMDLVSGQPIYLYGANCDSTLQGLGNLAPGQGCPGGRAINPCAFVPVGSMPSAPCPTNGIVSGLAPRNFLRGFGAWQMDLAVRREFPIYEGLKLQFRAEAFNLFNHPNFGNINSTFGQTTFGQATSTLANSLGVLNPLYQMGGPRSMQFALKLVF